MKRSLAPSQTGKQNSTSLSSLLGKRTNVTSSFQPPQTKKSKLVEFQTEKMEVENIKNISSSIEMDENEKAKIQSTEKISPLTNKPKINKGPLKQLVKVITPISSSSKEAPKNSTETSPSKNGDSALIVYKIFHTKRSNKKHKNWDEGILTIKGTLCTLKDMHGTDLAKSSSNSLKSLKELESGKTITVGAYEIEINVLINTNEYLSGEVLLKKEEDTPATTTVLQNSASVISKKFKSHGTSSKIPVPLFNPKAPNALVLYDPPSQIDENGKYLVSVVVDPCLSVLMRPHQKEGVKFMFDCVMGLKPNFSGYGCILADEMGLGKTFQTISLIWTILKQGIYGRPNINKEKKEKIIVITPATLVQNWNKEIKKWLGTVKLKPVLIGEAAKSVVTKQLEDFRDTATDIQPLLIISYDQVRQQINILENIPFALVICDEGHRLKNSNIKTYQFINSFHSASGKPKRIILSGTPIQNDLEEFYAMCNFVNPGILSEDLSSFKRHFANPILASRESKASLEQKKLGEEKAEELNLLTSNFILRRTNSILEKYLPPKVEQVVFCKLPEVQFRTYNSLVDARFDDLASDALSCIDKLRKVCNHPKLLYFTPGKGFVKDTEIPEDLVEEGFSSTHSGKLFVLELLLKKIKQFTSDKVVLVSNTTKVLDIFEEVCNRNSFKFLRLDGSTGNSQRQKYVDKFNEEDSDYFAFLLSTKAGGTGLNLIGANRLILFNSDWNPANDKQAMARIWRDGQNKNVWIYRFLCTGTLEEKIFQRQISKQALSHSIVDGKTSNKQNTFTKEELKDLFTFNQETLCETHDLLGCTDCLDEESLEKVKRIPGSKQTSKTFFDKEAALNELSNWKHTCSTCEYCDELLQMVQEESHAISFLFSSSNSKTLKEEMDEFI